MNAAESGAWAGLMATGPMSLSMFRLHRQLPLFERSPLPAATLTEEITKQLTGHEFSRDSRENLALLSHFLYGALCGAIYSVSLKHWKEQAWIKGALFGFGVWAFSYLGWIPAIGYRASALRMPVRKNALMVLSHLVWGITMAMAEQDLGSRANQLLDGRR